MNHCTRCGRQLHSEQSIKRGMGKHCAAKVKAATHTVTAKQDQINKAIELIEDNAIVQIRATVFRTVSTDGQDTYLSHPSNCTCPAGRNGRICYHQLAARIMLAA